MRCLSLPRPPASLREYRLCWSMMCLTAFRHNSCFLLRPAEGLKPALRLMSLPGLGNLRSPFSNMSSWSMIYNSSNSSNSCLGCDTCRRGEKTLIPRLRLNLNDTGTARTYGVVPLQRQVGGLIQSPQLTGHVRKDHWQQTLLINYQVN